MSITSQAGLGLTYLTKGLKMNAFLTAGPVYSSVKTSALAGGSSVSGEASDTTVSGKLSLHFAWRFAILMMDLGLRDEPAVFSLGINWGDVD